MAPSLEPLGFSKSSSGKPLPRADKIVPAVPRALERRPERVLKNTRNLSNGVECDQKLSKVNSSVPSPSTVPDSSPPGDILTSGDKLPIHSRGAQDQSSPKNGSVDSDTSASRGKVQSFLRSKILQTPCATLDDGS